MQSYRSSLSNDGLWTDGIGASKLEAQSLPLLITLPHSGENVPDQASWLRVLPEALLFQDVDRYTDELYAPFIRQLGSAWVVTEWHRYACDLNRDLTDVDQDAVIGAGHPRGTHPRGLVWVRTTKSETLLSQPIAREQFESLIKKCFEPFHSRVQERLDAIRSRHKGVALHLDLHSMPSRGTSEHRDPDQDRPDLVISDQKGKSAARDFVRLIQDAAQDVGFSTAYNWPYFGGKITERYGQPLNGVHTVQVELNRALYMDEVSKQRRAGKFEETQTRLGKFLNIIGCQVNSVHSSLSRA